MRISPSQKVAVYLLKDIEREGGDLLLYDKYASVADAVQAARKHLSKKGLKGKYKLLLWQAEAGKTWRRTIQI